MEPVKPFSVEGKVSLDGIWLGVVFADCAFSHFGVLLGSGVQRLGSDNVRPALNGIEPQADGSDSISI
jgi:hypothetical protein